MSDWLVPIILSISPVSELRLAIPLAIKLGINPYSAFFILTLLNILVMFPVFFFLDYIHETFLRLPFYKKSFEFYLRRIHSKIQKVQEWKYFALWAFVALPLPGTGAYTGSLIAWILNLDRKKSYLAIALGVLVAGVLVLLASIGVLMLVR